MSKIYDILKKHIAKNYVQYGDIIKNKVTIPKDVTETMKAIARENPDEIKKLIDRVKNLNNVTERMCIITIVIDYSDDKDLHTLWNEFLREVKKETTLLGQIS